MNRTRKIEILQVVAAMLVAAALAVALLATDRAASAATTTTRTRAHHKHLAMAHTHKKPIYIHIVGDRRAAENFAEQAYADQQAQIEAARQAEQARIDAQNAAYAAAQAAQLAAAQASANSWNNSFYNPYVQSGGYPVVFGPPFLSGPITSVPGQTTVIPDLFYSNNPNSPTTAVFNPNGNANGFVNGVMTGPNGTTFIN